jgi:hypothetical protein
MKRATALFLIFINSFGSEVFAAHVINTREDFRVFLSKWDTASADQKFVEWTNFEKKYADIYDEHIFNHASPVWLETKHKWLEELFAILPKIKDKILKLYDEAEQISESSINSLKTIFPDFSDQFTLVYLPTALSFNGKEIYHKTRKAEMVLIGIDYIANSPTNLNVLLTHELFHKHHFVNMAHNNFNSMASDLWTEGFATYVSHLANPELDLETLLFDGDLAKACAKPEYVADLAKKYLEVFYRTLTEQERTKFRKDWFRLDGEPTPKRPGYCLGYHLVKSIAPKHKLNDMIKWGNTQFDNNYEDKLERGLKSLLHP